MKVKKLLALFLVLAMTVTTYMPGLTLVVSAVPTPRIVNAEKYEAELSAEPELEVIESSTKENTNQASGIIYTKTSTAKSDGTIDITLTAHTTGVVRQISSVSPTDIVLVLDVSGSMDDTYDSSSVTTYNKVFGNTYTYRNGMFWWSEEHTGYGFNNSTAYYINTGTEETPVYTRVTRDGRDNNGYEFFEYSSGNTSVYVYPELNDGVPENRENDYSIYQFYSMSTSTTSRSRMDVLKSAVNSFIDTTATMNSGLDVSDMHTISIVKFAGPNYSNGTTDTPVITPGNGTYTQRNGSNSSKSNYSQVVAGLTPVDANGANTLKAAVASLDPAGSTAVDKGLALAEAVLMDRSQILSEGAVDRKEVVIVFTDGEPNHWNGFDESVANTAIQIAGRMENEADVAVYGVSVAPGADAADLDANINKFMHYMSSNYPDSISMDSSEENCDISAGYYMTPGGDMTLTMIFESIIQEIDHPTVTLGKEATMVDTISPYFDFVGSASNVKLQTSARNADGTWAEPVDDSSLSCEIIEDRLTVNGFDFDANYVSETARNGFYGKRLVISFTVVPDYNVIDAASATLMDGILPTNTGLALINDSDENSAAGVETPKLSTYTVIYKVDGADVSSYNRFVGSEVNVDAIPTKEGHTFSGWAMNGSVVNPGDEFTMPESDVEITGTFTVNSHNVSYRYSTTPPVGAPNLPETAQAQYGQEVTVAQPAVLEGYVFKGWYPLQTDVTVANGKFTMPDKDVTLVGYFENSTTTPYKVEHYLETLTEGVYQDAPVLVEDGFTGETGHTVTAIPLNRFTGFEYNEIKSADTISGSILPDGSLVLKVYYDRIEYTVTYGYDGDTQIENIPELPLGGTYKYGETVEVADKAEAPAGYTFTGWYRGTSDNPVDGTFTMPEYNVNLRGFFTANSG
ncbi:MAG: InlB B-repeat-containing protein, partial [Clostridia bacterium]|nr:InlB B-repeat-containing protein [Clostridia bacterium]